jgi:hypothetical protein
VVPENCWWKGEVGKVVAANDFWWRKGDVDVGDDEGEGLEDCAFLVLPKNVDVGDILVAKIDLRYY